MQYIWISREDYLFQKLLPQEPEILFLRTRMKQNENSFGQGNEAESYSEGNV